MSHTDNMSASGDTEFRVQELCTKQSWWNVPHLVKLNIMLMVPFFSSYIGGFDGSMLNGVQTLKHWQEGSYQRRRWRNLKGCRLSLE